MRLFVVARHGESELNEQRRVNGDPKIPVQLSERGVAEAELLGEQLAQLPVAACVHTRFARTRETAEIVLSGRDVPLIEEPLLDDIDVGELEGRSIDDYRVWKRSHTRDDPFPGGESLNDAARRYADGYETLLELAESPMLVICHEIPLRYLVNTSAGSDRLDRPVFKIANARPYFFSEEAVTRAVPLIRALAGNAGSA